MTQQSKDFPPSMIDSECWLMTHAEPRCVADGEFAKAVIDAPGHNPCMTCGGTGYPAVIDDEGYRRVRPCRGMLRSRRAELYNQAHIPSRYASADIKTFRTPTADHTSVRDALLSYLIRFSPGMRGQLFVGGPGVGKTHLLACMLKYMTLELGIPARYVEFTHLLSDLRALYAQNLPEAEILGPLLKVPVLAIDELGKGRCNDFELRIIDELISRRYNNVRLTTIFSSNYLPFSMMSEQDKLHNPGDSLGQRIGPRCESRIYEMCEVMYFRFNDYREYIHTQR